MVQSVDAREEFDLQQANASSAIDKPEVCEEEQLIQHTLGDMCSPSYSILSKLNKENK